MKFISEYNEIDCWRSIAYSLTGAQTGQMNEWQCEMMIATALGKTPTGGQNELDLLRSILSAIP